MNARKIQSASTPIGTRTNPLHWGDMSYVPPTSPFSKFLWKLRMWVETTFALSMLEPWEKLLILGTVLCITTFLFTSIYYYLPQHLNFIISRAKFYLYGEEQVSGLAGTLWKSIKNTPVDEL